MGLCGKTGPGSQTWEDISGTVTEKANPQSPGKYQGPQDKVDGHGQEESSKFRHRVSFSWERRGHFHVQGQGRRLIGALKPLRAPPLGKSLDWLTLWHIILNGFLFKIISENLHAKEL